MDSLKGKKFLFIALIVIGTSPIGASILLRYFLYIPREIVYLTWNVVSWPDFVYTGFEAGIFSIIFSYMIFLFSIYIHIYCVQRLQVLGYQKSDFFRFFAPVYGLYFAYMFANKLLSSDIEMIPQLKTGKGLNF